MGNLDLDGKLYCRFDYWEYVDISYVHNIKLRLTTATIGIIYEWPYPRPYMFYVLVDI